MTCLRKMLKIIELEVNKKGYTDEFSKREMESMKRLLEMFKDSKYPPCCIRICHDFIECEYLGQLNKETFFVLCKNCRRYIEKKVEEYEHKS